ncbi:NUDIX hydrolase [Fluviicola taffensis]|uniref:NUDIX hydrolase n=1 Tax=Fluviicola taffensis (strain DSM 16823 / NCIMB 13979 / RW262) TaxID=755732 RepID=F2IFG4_FLUTR|nr:NUDIX domain-containing protein [Fluviicola taffensis]AEA44649.1 NUDIX hydrolase [Fluviicola taffensis DSM 16823]
MYKVFIDNSVIQFLDSSEEVPLKGYDLVVNSFQFELSKLLDQFDFIASKVCLLVVYDDFELVFNQVFHAYEFMDAAGGIVKCNQRYLFIERHGMWDIPKGKLDANEQPWEAAVREIEEECGIQGPTIDRLLGVTFHTYSYMGRLTIKKNWWYALNYSGSMEVFPQEEESITQAIWIEKSEWNLIQSNTYDSIQEVLRMAEEW